MSLCVYVCRVYTYMCARVCIRVCACVCVVLCMCVCVACVRYVMCGVCAMWHVCGVCAMWRVCVVWRVACVWRVASVRAAWHGRGQGFLPAGPADCPLCEAGHREAPVEDAEGTWLAARDHCAGHCRSSGPAQPVSCQPDRPAPPGGARPERLAARLPRTAFWTRPGLHTAGRGPR